MGKKIMQVIKVILLFVMYVTPYNLVGSDTYKIKIMGRFDGETVNFLMQENLIYLKLMLPFQTLMAIMVML